FRRRCDVFSSGASETKRRHLFTVANQQHVADQHRMIPRLAVERRDARDFLEAIGGRTHERELAILRQNEQQVLIWQQQHLTMPVPAALPAPLAVLEAEAREDAAVESVGVTAVNDEIVE